MVYFSVISRVASERAQVIHEEKNLLRLASPRGCQVRTDAAGSCLNGRLERFTSETGALGPDERVPRKAGFEVQQKALTWPQLVCTPRYLALFTGTLS